LEFLRFLSVGTASASLTDANGGRVAWDAGGVTNGYEGALPYLPPGLLLDGSTPFDTTMVFLPETNAPASGGFYSAGGHNLLYGGMGWGDIAFGFNAADTGSSNSVDGILIGLSQGLQGMGLRLDAPVTDFGAMVASRDAVGQSRVFLIDAGAGSITPDLHLERDGFNSLTLRNRSTLPFSFRLQYSGTDNHSGTFEHAYGLYALPGKATLRLLLPADPADPSLTRELDLGSDGLVDSTEELPANGQLRIGKESGMLALRWRPAGSGEALETTSTLNSNAWSVVGSAITNDGPDRVLRLTPAQTAQFFRLRLETTNCLSLSAFSPGARPNPWETNGFKFEALDGDGGPLAQNTIASRDGYTGLDVQHTVRVHPADDCDVLHLDIFQTSGYVTLEAVGPLGVVVDSETLIGPGTGPERVTLRSFRGGIHYVRVVSPNGLCLILNVCCERTPTPAYQPNSNCPSFNDVQAGQYPSPFNPEGVIISADPGPVIIGPVSGLYGNWLKLTGTVEIRGEQVDEPCDGLRLLVYDPEGVIQVSAFNANNEVVGTAGPPPPSSAPQELVVSGNGIIGVVIQSNSDKAALQELCCGTSVVP
jgi:hypothetical protein